MWYDAPWFGFLPPPLGMLISIFVLIFLLITALRLTGGRRHRDRDDRRGRGPRDVLDDRFARGEIDRAEYEERRKLLER
jgi:putative membrane protein